MTYSLFDRLKFLGRLLSRFSLFFGPILGIVVYSMLISSLPEEQAVVGALGSLMAFWWITEAVPLAATAMIPIALFPLFGVRTVQEATAPYAHPLIFLFLGGFLLAIAMQRWQLHRRIALFILARSTTSAEAVIGGFMLATAFLSMWVSNTATAMMMLPIGMSVIEVFKHHDTGDDQEAWRRQRHFSVALLLGIAYGANIGGVGTLIGSPPNALLAAFLRETGHEQISFAAWMAVGMPIVIVMLPLTWFLLVRVLFPMSGHEIKGGHSFIQAEKKTLGPMSRAERMVAWVFVVTASLWILNPFLAELFPWFRWNDTSIAIAAGVVLFALPVDWSRRRFVLDWDSTGSLPWGILLLFGGGLSLAAAIKDSGLSASIGQGLVVFGDYPLWVLVGLIALVIVFLTEVTSNTATTAAFLPVILSLADTLGHSALVLSVPAVIAASFAFMLPVATPPNAVVYGVGSLSIGDMAKAGVWLNFLGAGLITLFTVTIILWVFG